MAVATLFFCGTASSREQAESGVDGYDNGELISRLGLRCIGEEGVTKFTIDGPGSGNKQEAQKIRGQVDYYGLSGTISGKGWDENVMLAIDTLLGRVVLDNGTWRPRDTISPNDVVGRSGKPRWVDDALSNTCFKCKTKLSGFFSSGKHHCRLCGQIFCDNCSQNRMSVKNPLTSTVQIKGVHKEQRVCDMCYPDKFRAFHHLQAMTRASEISQINCIGWSRGGVTTHMFANACAEEPLLSGKEIRLIAVDPVPGGSEMASHRVSITNENIKEYVAFYARDERSRCFSPTLPHIKAGACPAKIYFFPGNHSSLVGCSGGDNILYNSSVLVRHIAESHLQDWGTRFAKTMQLSDHEVLRYYDHLVKHRRHFEKLQKKSILGVNLGPVGFNVLQGGGRSMMVPADPMAANGPNAAWMTLQDFDLDAKNECFVNWHHVEMVTKHFPVCMSFLKGERVSLKSLQLELKRMKEHVHCHNLAAQMQRRLPPV
jgi:hypothetical protein